MVCLALCFLTKRGVWAQTNELHYSHSSSYSLAIHPINYMAVMTMVTAMIFLGINTVMNAGPMVLSVPFVSVPLGEFWKKAPEPPDLLNPLFLTWRTFQTIFFRFGAGKREEASEQVGGGRGGGYMREIGTMWQVGVLKKVSVFIENKKGGRVIRGGGVGV